MRMETFIKKALRLKAHHVVKVEEPTAGELVVWLERVGRRWLRLVPIPFADLLDDRTGKIRVRYADIHSEAYRTLHAYMIRLKREDFERPDQREALARAANLSEPEFVHRFEYVAD